MYKTESNKKLLSKEYLRINNWTGCSSPTNLTIEGQVTKVSLKFLKKLKLLFTRKTITKIFSK